MVAPRCNWPGWAPGKLQAPRTACRPRDRGLVRIGPLRALRRDVLGLTQRTTTLAGTEEVLIVPHTIALPFPSVGSSGRLGQHLRMKSWGQTGSEFHSLREYVVGDDIRRINWKASARATSLIVRETALEGIRRCTVVLDTTQSEYVAGSFEQAVIAAGSIIASSAHAGVNTRFATSQIDLRGPDVVSNTLRWLATVEPTSERARRGDRQRWHVRRHGPARRGHRFDIQHRRRTGPRRGQPGRDPRRGLRHRVQRQQSLRGRCHLDRVDDLVVEPR